MSLAVVALFTWLIVIVFAAVPKRFTLTEFVFLYFVCDVLTITVFAVLDVNVQWVPTTREVEKSFALYFCRFIEVPFLVILSANILHANFKSWWRWALVVVAVAILNLGDSIMRWFDLITYARWNVPCSVLMYGIFIVVMAGIQRWFVQLDRGETSNHESRSI